jgi:hypothetical protein
MEEVLPGRDVNRKRRAKRKRSELIFKNGEGAKLEGPANLYQ